MKRPPTKTLVVGHPIVAAPMGLTGVLLAFIAYRGGSIGLGLIAYCVLGAVYSAYSQARAYRAWQREWNAMAGIPPRGVQHWFEWLGALGIVAAAVAVLMAGRTTQHLVVAGVAALVTGWLLLVIVSALVRWARRRRARASSLVAVIARPVMPVPSLAEAYRALPPYCHALLEAQR